MILKLKFEVDTAENGEVAVTRLKDNNISEDKKYNLVFMDINMPIMNGYTATKIIKDLISTHNLLDVPIICLSAQDTDSHKKECEECGFSEQSIYISKILI